MSGRVAAVAGVVAGVAAVAVVIGALVAATPLPTPPPAASLALVSPSPSVGPSPSAAPSSAAPSQPAGSDLFHVGELAPPLVVPEVAGGTIDLTRLRGKPVWVNFWGTYCPPCADEFPLMNGYAAQYENEGLVILAINVREDEETAASFAASLQALFPIGLDTQGTAAAAWDAVVLPVHYWIDAEGFIRAGAAGGIGPDQMEEGLATIMGVTPSPGASPGSSSPGTSPAQSPAQSTSPLPSASPAALPAA